MADPSDDFYGLAVHSYVVNAGNTGITARPSAANQATAGTLLPRSPLARKQLRLAGAFPIEQQQSIEREGDPVDVLDGLSNTLASETLQGHQGTNTLGGRRDARGVVCWGPVCYFARTSSQQFHARHLRLGARCVPTLAPCVTTDVPNDGARSRHPGSVYVFARRRRFIVDDQLGGGTPSGRPAAVKC